MLLATDLDGTFLGGDAESRHQLYQLIASHPDIRLVFVTGRGLESVIPLLSDPAIPQPEFIISDVGATVVHGDTLQPVVEVQSPIEHRWPGEYRLVEAMSVFPGIVRQDVPQERRCSFFCDESALTPAVQQVAQTFAVDMLYSAGQYLDFLPAGVNKGSTLTALMKHLGVADDEVLVAGDTLNDLSMYEQNFVGVCVGKSEPALLAQTENRATVLHAQAAGCGGILEAISHFGFLGEAGIDNETALQHEPGKSDLVMVYHRLPYEEYYEQGKIKRRNPTSPNGILPTLMSFFADGKKGSWVAWSVHDAKYGEFETHTTIDREKYPNLVAARVALSKKDVDIFYKKFSKEAFWPTLHTFWERASFREDHWQVFLKVNRLFAERTAEEAAEGATVWIHDYNLWMVPAYLREMRPDVKIAFFHHTYFPSADVFNVLPWRRDIVGSLLQCDYIGFHIPRQSENFVDVARGVAPVTVKEKQSCAPRFLTYGCAVGLDEMTSEIEVHGRTIRLGAHPVGLDMGRIENALEKDEIRQLMADLRHDLQGVKLIMSVERLDYTKGILQKLEAYERLLQEYPELLGKVTLVTVCVPAAREMTVYNRLQNQIEQAVGRINGRFATLGWTPVQFFFRAVPFERLVAYYAMADVMWITPLRDGLNLVAKEYVATQGLTSGSGVLVLSEFTGAAAELRGAVLANPHDPHELMVSCHQALTMHKSEARARLREGYDIVRYYDIAHWGSSFLQEVQAVGRSGPALQVA